MKMLKVNENELMIEVRETTLFLLIWGRHRSDLSTLTISPTLTAKSKTAAKVKV